MLADGRARPLDPEAFDAGRAAGPGYSMAFDATTRTKSAADTVAFLQRYASRLLTVGVGDLADKLGPGHVHGPVHLPGLRSRIILENFYHQSCVVGQNDTGLQHAQEPDLTLGLAEGSTVSSDQVRIC